LPSGHENFHDNSVCRDLAGVPRIVSEEIWTSCLAGVLAMQSASDTKVNHSVVKVANHAVLQWQESFY